MQPRHFEMIAGIISDLTIEPTLRQAIALSFASKLSITNSLFDPERFVRACIPDKEAILNA